VEACKIDRRRQTRRPAADYETVQDRLVHASPNGL
jgi:hypothetical protein